MNALKYSSMLLVFLMMMVGCSSEGINAEKEVEHPILSQNSANKGIPKNDQDTPQINSEINSKETQNSPTNTLPVKEKDTETPVVSQVSSGQPEEDVKLEEDQSGDFIVIEGTKYINLMHEEKFTDWITIAEKFGAKLYAIPYSDVFAIVKDGEVLVGMSTGVANAKSNHIDILSEMMSDKGVYAPDIINGIKQVNRTGESVHLVGPEEFDDDFSIFKQDDWIVVSW
jgi:hypothetical protein